MIYFAFLYTLEFIILVITFILAIKLINISKISFYSSPLCNNWINKHIHNWPSIFGFLLGLTSFDNGPLIYYTHLHRVNYLANSDLWKLSIFNILGQYLVVLILFLPLPYFIAYLVVLFLFFLWLEECVKPYVLLKVFGYSILKVSIVGIAYSLVSLDGFHLYQFPYTAEMLIIALFALGTLFSSLSLSLAPALILSIIVIQVFNLNLIESTAIVIGVHLYLGLYYWLRSIVRKSEVSRLVMMKGSVNLMIAALVTLCTWILLVSSVDLGLAMNGLIILGATFCLTLFGSMLISK